MKDKWCSVQTCWFVKRWIFKSHLKYLVCNKYSKDFTMIGLKWITIYSNRRWSEVSIWRRSMEAFFQGAVGKIEGIPVILQTRLLLFGKIDQWKFPLHCSMPILKHFLRTSIVISHLSHVDKHVYILFVPFHVFVFYEPFDLLFDEFFRR